MGAGGGYLEGATVRMQATFSVSGSNTDPTTVTLKVLPPGSTTATSYTYAGGTVTKSTTGVYYKDLALSTTGTWHYRWIGTGAAAGVAESPIVVYASAID